MAFYQKYRSQKFGEMVGQEHIVLTLLSALSSDKFVHAYLFTGPRGIGKTSTARLLAKAINCQNKKDGSGEPCNECDSCTEIVQGRSIDVVEIDAASNTGVDEIRDLIEKARLMPTKSKFKVYIIDEIHMLSKSAFNALLKTLEEPPAHVVFIMATTEAHKIPATILSRAQRYDFKRASKEEISKNLRRVAEAEKIKIDEASIDLIAVSASGGHRDALSLLEQVSSGGKEVNIEKTREVLGLTEGGLTFDFVEAIFNESPEEGLKIVHQLYGAGKDIALFNKNVIELMRKILLLQISDKIVFEDTDENVSRMKSLCGKVVNDRLVEIMQFLIEAGTLLKDVNYPVVPIEIAIIKSCGLNNQVTSHESRVTSGNESLKSKTQVSISGRHPESVRPAQNRPVLESAAAVRGEGIPDQVRDDIKNSKSVNSQNSKLRTQNLNEATVPVPVVEMTKDIWQQVIEKVRGENATLAALLRDAKPSGMTGDTLHLGVKFKFHKDRISEAKNSECLEKIVCDITGCNYKVVCKTEEKRIEPATGSEDIWKAVAEVFEVE